MAEAYQILHNPRTGEVRRIDIAAPGSTAEIASLWQQGWLSGEPKEIYPSQPPPTYELPSPTPSVDQPQPSMDALQPYVQDGRVDLIQLVKSGDTAAITQAENMFDYESMKEARYLAKMPVTKEAWAKLGPASREKARLVTPVTEKEWREMDEKERNKHYIMQPVGARAAAKLGPAVLGRSAYYSPSIWENITPWSEEKGEAATAKRNLIWSAELVVPGVYTARHWKEMPMWQKGMNIALDAMVMAPVIYGVTKVAAPKSVKIPTTKGEITVWKGFSVQGKPIIGISESKLTIGKTGVKYPKATTITAGYEPVTKVETSIMAARNSLGKMGVSKSEIDKAMATLKARREFAGKKSPFLTKKAPLPTVERLTPEEVGEIFTVSKQYGRKIDKIYGTVSLEPQLAPELRFWRPKHDIDIQTLMNAKDTDAFTNTILGRLQARWGRVNYRINPKESGVIEKNIDDIWKKITDIHSREAMPSSEIAAEGAYGMKHAEKAVTISYPNIGKLELMTASEMGKRKFASIMQWRGGTFAPVHYRTKDIVDFYVILRTFKGPRVADRWARIYGLDSSELLRLAKESPPEFTAWKFIPNAQIRGRSPKITFHPLSGIKALSPATKLSKSSMLFLRSISTSLRTKPSIKVSPAKISPKSAKAPSPRYYKSGKAVTPDIPSTSRVSLPSRSISPTSRSVSPRSTSPVSSPPSKSVPARSKPTPSILDIEIKRVERRPREDPGVITFPMGVVNVKIRPPYRRGKQDIIYIRRTKPAKGKGSMQRGLKTEYGFPPEKLILKQGLNTITITNGQSMQFGMKGNKRNAGPGIMMPNGKVRRQVRRRILTAHDLLTGW